MARDRLDALREVEEIREMIDKFQKNVEEVKLKQSAILSAGVPDKIPCVLRAPADCIMAKAKYESAYLRMKKTQHTTLSHQFVEVMTEYNRAQADYRDRHKDRLLRQLELTGQNITDQDLDNLLEQDNPAVFTQGAGKGVGKKSKPQKVSREKVKKKILQDSNNTSKSDLKTHEHDDDNDDAEDAVNVRLYTAFLDHIPRPPLRPLRGRPTGLAYGRSTDATWLRRRRAGPAITPAWPAAKNHVQHTAGTAASASLAKLTANSIQVEEIRERIEKLQANVEEVKLKHSAILTAWNINEEMNNELEDFQADMKETFNETIEMLKHMEQSIEIEVERQSNKIGADSSNLNRPKNKSANLRMRITQHAALWHKFVEVMTEYNSAQADYRDRCENWKLRQLAITHQNVSEQELKTLLEQNNPSLFTNGGEMVNRIEFHVNNSVENIEDGLDDVEDAIRNLKVEFVLAFQYSNGNLYRSIMYRQVQSNLN
ncbi:hypothetical protein MSG28_003290 [Choristoneura fumiferana]|uniref:Uncharacterized protein n=1 Tax=Choristoneura fumiferana TaxID=7141 RepID=A0ACC0KEX1_CHOFU|nr:hypothetical protein MSG28_003290 [Choristoneura fumiferana]